MSALARMRRFLRTPARRIRAARIAFASLAALAMVAILVFATVMLVAPESDAGHSFGKVERGDDYLVYTVPDLPIDGVAQGHWSVPEGKKVPDSIRIVAYSDLANLLAGKPLAFRHRQVNLTDQPADCPCHRWAGWGYVPSQGYAEVRYDDYPGNPVTAHSPTTYFCGTCQDPRLTLVWTHGTAWTGAKEVKRGDWTLDARGQPQGDAPVLWRGIVNEHGFIDWFLTLDGMTLLLAEATAAAGAWLAVEAWVARRARRKAPPAPPAPASTEDLLRLVHLSERYLAALTGYFLMGGLVVLLGTAVVCYLAVPALLRSAHDHLVNPDFAVLSILMLAPFLAVVSLALWGLAFQRVRRERARWRRLGVEFDKFTDTILAR